MKVFYRISGVAETLAVMYGSLYTPIAPSVLSDPLSRSVYFSTGK